MADTSARIPVGYVRRAHGLRGDVIVRSQTDDPNRFQVGAAFATDEDPARSLTVAEIREHKEGLLIRFAEIGDRNEAEAMRGVSVTIAVAERRQLDPDEFWPDDLEGLDVVDTGGTKLGVLSDVVTGSAQDRLVVATGSGSVDVPFVRELVPDIDLEAGRIVVDPPPGLFD